MRFLFFVTIAISIAISLHAQEVSKEIRTGTVTFISSQNYYVKFENTQGMNTGDTLYIKEGAGYLPAIIVKFLSSSSAAGELLSKQDIKLKDQLYAFVKLTEEQKVTPQDTSSIKTTTTEPAPDLSVISSFKPEKKNYRGRVSVQSFSSLSNITSGSNDQRWRYSVMFNSEDIAGSPLSLSSYFIFTYRNNDLSGFSDNVPRFLKVYDFAIKYSIDESSEIWAGRHLNRRISNISSIDGLQYEKNSSSLFAGVVAGSRPDFNDMGFNFKLFQYGGYVGRTDTVDNGYMENTVAIMEQTNNFKTDRRFIYLQHSNNILSNFNFFLSSEVDLFEKIKEETKNTFSLTGIFASARYTPVREVSLSLSYDARKDVIYYETYRSIADSIIDRETRQGLRAGVNLRLFDNLFAGLSAGYRFQKSDSKPSSNYNVYLSYAMIPVVEVIPSASFTKLQSSYIDGTLLGVRLSRSLFDISDLAIGYQNTRYKFISGDLVQQILSIDLSTRIWEYFYLTASYEGTFEHTRTWGRALFDFTARF